MRSNLCYGSFFCFGAGNSSGYHERLYLDYLQYGVLNQDKKLEIWRNKNFKIHRIGLQQEVVSKVNSTLTQENILRESPNEVHYWWIQNIDRGGTPQRGLYYGPHFELRRPILLGGSSNES